MDLKSSYFGCAYTLRRVDDPNSWINIMEVEAYDGRPGYSLEEIIGMNVDEIIEEFKYCLLENI